MVCFQMTSWLVGTKHFPKSKTLPRIQNTFQNPKHFPESKNTSQNPKTLPRIQNTSQRRRCFGFWDVFLDSGKCFWILGSVLSLRATVIRSDHAAGQEQKCSLECSEPNTLWMQIPRKKKIVLCCVWRWGTPGRWGNLLRWGKKITPPLQAELRF